MKLNYSILLNQKTSVSVARMNKENICTKQFSAIFFCVCLLYGYTGFLYISPDTHFALRERNFFHFNGRYFEFRFKIYRRTNIHLLADLRKGSSNEFNFTQKISVLQQLHISARSKYNYQHTEPR